MNVADLAYLLSAASYGPCCLSSPQSQVIGHNIPPHQPVKRLPVHPARHAPRGLAQARLFPPHSPQHQLYTRPNSILTLIFALLLAYYLLPQPYVDQDQWG